MKKKVFKIILGIILILVFCLLGILYLFRYSIMELANYMFFNEYELEELSVEQKVEDFEQFHTTIVESVPFLDEVEKWYGIDFEERKEYYISEVKNTKDNFEFYCVMKAIATDVASFHTDVCLPLYWNVRNLSCHNDDETVKALGMRAKVIAWEDVLKEKVNDYEDVDMINVYYADGKYYVENLTLPETYKDLQDYELISVAGVSAEDYIANSLSVCNKYYDSANAKAYRYKFSFNGSVGEKLETVWYDGEQYISKELYWDRGVELVANMGYLYSDKYLGNIYEPSVTMYRDDVNRLEYIRINDFMNEQGEELKEYLENVQYSKIVIDLRSNCGGHSTYYRKYLYPALYSEDVKYTNQFRIPDTESNRLMIDDGITRFGLSGEKVGADYVYTTNSICRGKQTEEREIYYLISSDTGSAADEYVDLVKENNLGIVVGENTSGEGLGASYICDDLGNSSLIFTYFPSVPVGEKAANSCVGTAPDIYVQLSKADYDLRQQYKKDGTLYEYEKRLEYDAMLKWVIDQR